MSADNFIKLTRNCNAILIPAGDKIKLMEGTLVKITQSLGGDYTLYVNGNLVTILAKDADAIGKTPVENKFVNTKNVDKIDESQVWEQLKTCYDPEIPVNIVDLGLIYDLNIESNKNTKNIVNIKMTLTAPGCGMGPYIAQDVESKVKMVPGVVDVIVELVWEPVWNRDMMTEDAKLELGMM